MTNRTRTPYPVYVGFSADEIEASNVCEASLRGVSGSRIDLRRICRQQLWREYTRASELRGSVMFDVVSDAPMSTDHAIARFFIPYLCGYAGWALFMDSDVIVRRDVCELFEQRADEYAVMCVKHAAFAAAGEKKIGAIQTTYPRKNWSSVMLINCGHPANRWLDLDHLNTTPGRDLHRFSWLHDDQIGLLHPRWNYLVNVIYPPVIDPAIVHFTEGTPNLAGHGQDPYADEWFQWAAVAGYRFPATVVAGGV